MSEEPAPPPFPSPAPSGPPCFQCRGRGSVLKKARNEQWQRQRQNKRQNKRRSSDPDIDTHAHAHTHARTHAHTPGEQQEQQEQQQEQPSKWVLLWRQCPSCQGAGTIARSRRKNADSSFRKKRVARSFPSFSAPGPLPAALTSSSSSTSTSSPSSSSVAAHLQAGPDEELCFLAGHWKIFQKLDRHRYSTDDLCTSYFACQTLKQLGYERPLMLDIGCGLGSVLMTNAWQFPDAAACVGIEAQKDRYDMALRSVEYNIGGTSNEGLGEGVSGRARVKVFNADLRELCMGATDECVVNGQIGYDLVTGTPPYFPMATAAVPGCGESSGCLFELRGGVEDYCAAAALYLRRPPKDADVHGGCSERPSVFTVVNTALASARVYSGCEAAGLSVVKRFDVIPRTGKPPLFNVFVIVLDEWLKIDGLSEVPVFPQLTRNEFGPLDISVCPARYRVEGSVRGEEVVCLTVRDEKGNHTDDYCMLLSHLGKPSSRDKESYVLPGQDATTIGEIS